MTKGWKVEQVFTGEDSPICVWRIYDPKVEGCMYIIMEEGELTFLEKIEEELSVKGG